MKIETPILMRLGPVPFWRGREKCLDTLEEIYRRARERSGRLLDLQKAKEAKAKELKGLLDR